MRQHAPPHHAPHLPPLLSTTPACVSYHSSPTHLLCSLDVTNIHCPWGAQESRQPERKMRIFDRHSTRTLLRRIDSTFPLRHILVCFHRFAHYTTPFLTTLTTLHHRSPCSPLSTFHTQQSSVKRHIIESVLQIQGPRARMPMVERHPPDALHG